MDREKAGKFSTENDSHAKFSYLVQKRIFDILFSLILLIFLTPLLLLIALLIVGIDGRPILFKQFRTGKNNKLFVIWKFRTMRANSDSGERFAKKNWSDGVPDDFVFKSSVQSNVTTVGKFLQKYSLDELPQLFNVLKGDMSIVGPRPEIPEITKYYNENQRQRLLMKPGITGLSQTCGRSKMTHGQKITYDLYYVKNYSLLLDARIVISTILQVFTGKGAY